MASKIGRKLLAVAGITLELDVTQLCQYVGRTFGPSRAVIVGQALIDEFAQVTGDDAWYHVDPERAAVDLPYGSTIAHGLLTLSLIPRLSREVLHIAHLSRALQYGFDRIRFPSPVCAGDSVRLWTIPLAVDAHAAGTLIRLKHVVKADGANKPAMIAERLLLSL